MKILICTDGSQSSVQSAELVAKLKFPPDIKLTVLGVSENIDHLEDLAKSMDKINDKLGSLYPLDRKIRNGLPIEEIMAEAVESAYDLVAVGGGKDQLGLLQPQLGSTASRLARKLHTHFLVARNIPHEFKKILICVGPDIQTSRTIELGGKWISNTSANLRLLHVIPEDKTDDGQTLSEDISLKKAYQELIGMGINNIIDSKLRYGIVVEEILHEVNEGNYELLVIGAHYQPGQDRWQGTLLDDVTDQLLHRTSCSVLII